jgi:hypothetical protein
LSGALAVTVGYRATVLMAVLLYCAAGVMASRAETAR